LVLPLTFPLLAAAIELFQAILQNGTLELDSIWLTLLVVADVLYFILGLNLFSFAIRE
jgi:ABC-type transport system involved in cytochrome c biogenesis permease component